MPQRRQTTTFSTSSDLKAALLARGYVSELEPQPFRYFYDGSAQSRFVCLDQMTGVNGLRTVTMEGNQTEADFVDLNDTTPVRIWTYRELEIFIGNIPGVSFSDSTQSGNTWTHRITRNGTDYTAQDSVRVEAQALALIAALNEQVQSNRTSRTAKKRR